MASRLSIRFGLRWMFLVVIAIAAALGYEANWLRRRHAFLEEQLCRQAAVWDGYGDDAQRDQALEWWKNQLYSADRAPGLLWMLGESAVDQLFIIIPEDDIADCRHERPEGGTYLQYEMSADQRDFRRAKWLFPEARIIAIRWREGKADGVARGFFEVHVSQGARDCSQPSL